MNTDKYDVDQRYKYAVAKWFIMKITPAIFYYVFHHSRCRFFFILFVLKDRINRV